MTPRRLPATRAVRRSLTLAAPIAVAIVVWLAVSPLVAVQPVPGAPGPVGPAGSPLAVASADRPSAVGTPATSGSPPTAVASPTATPSAPATRRPTTPMPAASAPTVAGSGAVTGPSPAASVGLPPVARRVGRPSATPLMKAALDRQLERLRARLGIPGMSAAVLFADGTLWSGTAGLADVEAGRAVTEDTPFAVGSISKTFTAALVLSLAAEGRVSLDTSVVSYLPTLRIDPRITVRQLLDHTSGLNDFFFHPKIDAALLAEPDRTWRPADALAYVGKPYFEPNAGYHYSNTNYLVLGMLAETVGEAPLAEQLRARFLGPLRLTGTTTMGAEPPAAAPAHGYRFTGASVKLPPIDLSGGSPVVPFRSVVTAAGAAGSIASTAVDLVHWAQALYGGDALGESTRRAMLGGVDRTAAYGRGGAGYGLGVQTAVIDGRPTFGHSGRLLGARAVVRWLPTESMTIAVLTNQSRADPRTVARALLQIAVVQPADCTGCPGGW